MNSELKSWQFIAAYSRAGNFGLAQMLLRIGYSCRRNKLMTQKLLANSVSKFNKSYN